MEQVVQIALAAPEDRLRLVEVWRSSVSATHHFLSPADFSEIESEVAEAYVPQAALWAAYDGAGTVQAFMGMTGSHIDALFVHAQMRGRGWGSALLRHAVGLAGHDLTVDVNEQNKQAVAFYQRHHFRNVGRSAIDGAGRPYPLLHMRTFPPGAPR